MGSTDRDSEPPQEMSMRQASWAWVAISVCLGVLGCASHDRPSAQRLPDGGLLGAAGSGQANGGGGIGSAGQNGAGTSGTGTAGTLAGAAGTGSLSKLADYCNGSCQCSDGIDNDGDGQIDGFDTECTGPYDNDEGSFATGIPGDNVDPKWQDCFYDGNSGGGDDGCRYSTDCLTGKKPPTDPDCKLSQQCIDFCKPLVPNGCDCFGCCELRKADGTTLNVVADASCDAAHPEKCAACTPSSVCGNPCDSCELCVGKTMPDVSCATQPPTAGTGGSGSAGTGGAGSGSAGTGGAGTGGAGTGGAGSGSAGTGGAGTGSAGTGGGGGVPYVCGQGLSVCTTSTDCGVGHYCSFGCCLSSPPG